MAKNRIYGLAIKVYWKIVKNKMSNGNNLKTNENIKKGSSVTFLRLQPL